MIAPHSGISPKSEGATRAKAPLADGLAPLAGVLGFAFVATWSIDEGVLSAAGKDAIPLARWTIVTLIMLLSMFSLPRGFARAWSGILFVGTYLFALPFGEKPLEAVPVVLRIIGALCFSIYVGSLSARLRTKVLGQVAAAAAVVVCMSLAYGIASPSNAYKLIGTERLRLYGMAPHPGVLGYLASFTAVYHATCLIFRTQLRSALANISSTLLIAISVYVAILADSRTAQLAMIVGFLIALLARALSMRSLFAVGSRGLPLFLIVFGYMALATPILAVGADLLATSNAEVRYSGSNAERLSIWRLGLQKFDENWLVGAGPGYSFRLPGMRDDIADFTYFHSALINYLAKSGLLGAGAFLIMIAASARSVGKLVIDGARLQIDGREMNPLPFFLSAYSITVIFSSSEAALQSMYFSFLLFFCTLNSLKRRQ